MRAACALRINSGRIIFISRLSRSAERSKRIFTGGVGNELPQSKPAALPAPSGREPLARPEVFLLHLMFSNGVNGVRPLSHRYAMPALPKGEPRALPKAFSLHLKLQQQASDLGSPFGGAGAGAPERAYAKKPRGAGALRGGMQFTVQRCWSAQSRWQHRSCRRWSVRRRPAR